MNILSYLRQRHRVLLWALASAAVFTLSFALFRLPVAAALYPAGVCLLCGAVLLGLDHRRTAQRHRALRRLLAEPAALPDHLPEAADLCEADYQALLRALLDEQQRLLQKAAGEYADLLDYYTVWAHQVKTPLASLRLRLQGEDSDLCRQLQLDLGRVEQYVDMVLTYLRLDSDATDYVFRPCKLDPLIRSCVRKFAGEFIVRRLKLVYEPLQAEVLTDEKWLAFVIEQVLSNALKYTPSGSITISLAPDQTLVIRDTGIGIAPEDLPRVFDRGYTGCNGRTDRRASGIGLYLCQRICRNLGHSLRLTSRLGEGTEVHIGLSRRATELE